jgi:hypothetical protein
MKYRLTASAILLSLFLVSFSFAKDNTPASGNSSPISAAIPATAPTVVSPPSTTPAVTPSVEVTATAAPTPGNISGTLINGSGGGIPDGQKVTLVGLDRDTTGAYQKVLESQSSANHDGSYRFVGVEIALNRAFLIITTYGGVEYQSDPVVVKDATLNYTIPITVYDKSNDFNILTIDQVHLKFDYTSQKAIQVTELFIVTNPGKLAMVVTSDGTTIPFLKIPAGASGLQFQLAQGSAQLLNATGGFAILPGAGKQYGFLASFSMPYGRNLKYNQLFDLPVTSLTVIVPQGMRLSGENLTDGGTQTVQNQTYLLYKTDKISSGSSISLVLSGKPGISTGFKFDRQTITIIGICAVGILFIILGVYLYLHDRARSLVEEQAAQEEQNVLEEQDGQILEDASGVDRDGIMDAMITLDDQFAAGDIPKEAYEKRREELKELLKGILPTEN